MKIVTNGRQMVVGTELKELFEKKLKRLEKLIKRASIIVCTDSVEVSQGLSDLGVSMGRKIKTYVQVNSGLQRCSREPGEETVELVKSIIGLPGIEIIGLITHAGFSYDYVGEDSIITFLAVL